jgi:uncharacterized membrane protein
LAAGALDASTITAKRPQRLETFDWMRGLACVLMFQTHCYDAWLAPAARSGKFFMWSQLVGSMPAPLFLFLTGISAVLMARKVSAGGAPTSAAAGRLMKRGFEIWALGLLFRVQEYLIAFPWAPWTDLLRVDVLNCIGVSLVLVSLALYLSKTWARLAMNAAFSSAVIIMLSPLVWTHRFTRLPWFIASYLDGVHNQGKPLPGLFPIFPWTAFAFAGVVVACILQSQKAKRLQGYRIPLIAAAGLLVAALGYAFDHLPFSVFPASMYDFWHTSSGFFLVRVGVLLLILALSDLRCRMPSVISKSKALVLMGQHSLLVYWVHIEFVYGRLHVLPRRGMSVIGASLGLVGITIAMLLLAYVRSKWPLTRKGMQRSRATAAG